MLLCRAHKLLDQYLAISDSNAHGTIRGNFEPQSPGKTTVSTLPWARWLTVAAPHLNCIDRVSFVHFAQLQSRGNFRPEATSDPRLQTRGAEESAQSAAGSDTVCAAEQMARQLVEQTVWQTAEQTAAAGPAEHHSKRGQLPFIAIVRPLPSCVHCDGGQMPFIGIVCSLQSLGRLHAYRDAYRDA